MPHTKKSTINKIKSIALALALLVAGTSYAQTESHSHKAAHGGTVQTAGDYHIEMVAGADKISFYLLDAKESTLTNKAVTGTAVFEFINKTKATAPLGKGSKNALMVETPKANVFTFCTVSLVVKGKTVTARFNNDAISQSDIKHGHQH